LNVILRKPVMTSLALSSRIRKALENYGERTVVEAGDGRWRLTGAQLLDGAASLFKALEPHTDRPLIAYLRKSPLYYAFTICSFLNRLDFCPLKMYQIPIWDSLGQLSIILAIEEALHVQITDESTFDSLTSIRGIATYLSKCRR
jgi:hypothetical protein